jgi:hypothetical protein
MPAGPNQSAEQTLPSARWTHSFRQEILDSLDLARASDVEYIGGRAGVLSTNSGQAVDRFCKAAAWESAGPAEWRLPDGVYDMRQTLRYLAEHHNRLDPDGSVTKEFRVQFSRSIRILCARGELIAGAPDLPNFVHRRFVRRSVEPWPDYAHAGPTQQLIMATLDEAKQAKPVMPGYVDGILRCNSQRIHWQRYQDAGWEKIDYQHWRVPDDVYDLRVSLAYLRTIKPGFGSSFVSAVQHLFASGALIFEAPDIPKLKQHRFVKRGPAPGR